MPPPERKGMYQRAVYWAAVGRSADGQVTVSSTPVEIACVWDDKQSQMLDRDGNTVAVDATVTVRQEVLVDSILWKGTLAQLPGDGIPTSNVMEVKMTDFALDLKGRTTARQLGLLRRGGRSSFPQTTP